MARPRLLAFLTPLLALAIGGLGPAEPQSRLSEPFWAHRYKQVQEELRQCRFDLLFLGDSLTSELATTSAASWEDINAVWRRFYADRNAVNIGFAGDTTANLLWRIQAGEIDACHPRAIVLLIGTNNTAANLDWSAEQSVGAIQLIVAELRKRAPQAHILVLGIPPNGYGGEALRRRLAINAMLSSHRWNDPGVGFIPLDAALLATGNVAPALFRECFMTPPKLPLHMSREGWMRVATAIEPTLSGILKDRWHADDGPVQPAEPTPQSTLMACK